jgi:MFS family permease
VDRVNQPGPAGRRDDYLLRFAFVVSSTGDWIYRFALPLLVLRLTGSAVSTAFTYVIEFIPYIVIGLFAGNLADRADRRRVLIVCDSGSAVIVALIAVLATTHHPPIALLYVAALVLASVRPFYFPAFQGFIVDRVLVSRRAVVNAWVEGTDSALNLLGPVVGIGVVVVLGPAVASAVNAVSFLLSALLIARTAASAARADGWLRGVFANVGADFAEGVRLLVRNGALLWGTLLMTAANFATLAVESNLVFVVIGPSERRPAVLGAVFAAQGIGALAGASLAPRLMRRLPVGRLLASGMGLLALALLAPALVHGTVALAVAWLVAGLATSVIVVPWFTYRQDIVPGTVIGRVTSVSRAVSYLTIPLGAVVGSWVVTAFGQSWLFVVAGVVMALVWRGTVVSPLGRARHDDTAADTDDAEESEPELGPASVAEAPHVVD